MDNSRRDQALNALDRGVQGTVISINCPGPIRRRLMDMGLTPGTQVTVDGTAPLGDPIIIRPRMPFSTQADGSSPNLRPTMSPSCVLR